MVCLIVQRFTLKTTQKAEAECTIKDVDDSGLWPDKVVTEVEPLVISGKQSQSIKIIWNASQMGIPAIMCAPIGSYHHLVKALGTSVLSEVFSRANILEPIKGIIFIF